MTRFGCIFDIGSRRGPSSFCNALHLSSFARASFLRCNNSTSRSLSSAYLRRDQSIPIAIDSRTAFLLTARHRLPPLHHQHLQSPQAKPRVTLGLIFLFENLVLSPMPLPDLHFSQARSPTSRGCLSIPPHDGLLGMNRWLYCEYGEFDLLITASIS